MLRTRSLRAAAVAAVAPFLLPSATLRAQAQTLVVPAAFAQADAGSYLWLPGASRDVRQQTLVGQSHLLPLLGRVLTALELRRTAADEAFAGGVADLTVTLSTSPNHPLRCSRTFADNTGAAAVQVFAGQVALPNSPPHASPNVAWSPDNVVRIGFQTPFVYTGGTLCIDVVGRTVPGQNADWWMADAAFDDLAGAAVDVGDGCGIYGGPHGRWSFTARRQLVPGGHAEFTAYGTPGGLAVVAFGSQGSAPIPLLALGLPAPGCALHLGSLDVLLPALFDVPVEPELVSCGGAADVVLRIPDDPAVFGITMATQWFDLGQLAASNALRWTVAGTMPSLDMAVVDGDANAPDGEVSVHLAHVLRFEHQ